MFPFHSLQFQRIPQAKTINEGMVIKVGQLGITNSHLKIQI